ncbi:hypothetical protein ACG7TL_001136 [Trametes sanguinea]
MRLATYETFGVQTAFFARIEPVTSAQVEHGREPAGRFIPTQRREENAQGKRDWGSSSTVVPRPLTAHPLSPAIPIPCITSHPMDSSTLVVVECAPDIDQPEDKAAMSERDALRAELRKAFTEAVVKHTGRARAHLRYKPEEYAEVVVAKYGVRFINWPDDICFCNLSDKKLGGIKSLRELHRRWFSPEDETRRLCLRPATDDEIAAARADFLSVHPTPHLLGSDDKPAPKQPAPVLLPAVYHPRGLYPLGLHPTSTQPKISTACEQEKPKRKQRNDVKRRRKHKKLAGDLRKLPPKRGVTSRRLVLNTVLKPAPGSSMSNSREIEWEMAVDDPIEEFLSSDGYSGMSSEVDEIESSASGEDGFVHFPSVEDPIEEFESSNDCSGTSTESDEIESMSGWD